MSLCRSFLNLVLNHPSRLIVSAITRICPEAFFKLIYSTQRGKFKKPVFSLSFDCDFIEDVKVIPKILEKLKQYSIRADFACIGSLIKKFPKEHKAILQQGHEIINHTYSHPSHEILNPKKRFNELSAAEQKEEITKCHRICQKILEYEPTGFRIPHFAALYTKTIYSILRKLGYKYSSSIEITKAGGHAEPFMIENILEFPLSVCPKHPFTTFETYHSFLRGGGFHAKRGAFFKLFQVLIETGIKSKTYMNIYFDPQDMADNEDFDNILELLDKKRDAIEIKTYEDFISGQE